MHIIGLGWRESTNFNISITHPGFDKVMTKRYKQKTKRLEIYITKRNEYKNKNNYIK